MSILTAAPDAIRELAMGFQKSRVLLTAFELGLFTQLGSSRRTSADVAAAIGSDARATDRLMNALCALGLLAKEGGMFRNTDEGLRYLNAASPEYLGGLGHTAHLWHLWSGLTRRVHPQWNGGDDWTKPFIAAMHDRARSTAAAVIRTIAFDGVRTMLDVGGGSGAYAMAFVRAVSDCHATVFDLPTVTPLTREYIAREGLSDRIDTRDGDYTSDPLGDREYDLVLLSAIVHSNAPAVNAALIASCARALRAGGRVVVQDFIMDDDRTTPAHGAMFAINMLAATEEGDTFTAAEVGQWMRAAGLGRIERFEPGSGVSQIVGTRD